MYIVEGNIGVGKSTFLDLIAQHCPEVETIQEPVTQWAQDVSGESLLDLFYKNPKRWAYTIETLAMIYRTRDYAKEQSNPNPKRVMERSVYSGHYCFAYNDLDSGYFTKLEWELYNKWVTFLLRDQCRPPMGFIYLQSTPEICYERVIKRQRSSETSLTIDVLNKIHDYHERFLVHKQNIFDELKKTPVLILDCTNDFVKTPDIMRQHADAVRNFFDKTMQQTPVESSRPLSL